MQHEFPRFRNGRLYQVAGALFGFLVFFSSGPAPAQNATETAPKLRVASPFAGSVVESGVDAAEHYLVTVSPDAAATVWDLRNEAKPMVLRTPDRKAQQTSSAGVAMSPDGKLIAIGVPPEAPDEHQGSKISLGTGVVYIYDHFNARLLPAFASRIDGIRVPTRVTKLKFSPEGDYLVGLLGDGCGVRVWRVADWSLFGSDDGGFGKDGVSSSYCKAASGEFDVTPVHDLNNADVIFPQKEGSKIWFTVSGKSGLRNYEKLETGIRAKFLPRDKFGLKTPASIALDKTKRRLAVGDADGLRVALIDLDRLEPAREKPFAIPEDFVGEAERKRDVMQLSEVAWIDSKGQELLLAGGFITDQILSEIGKRRIGDPDAPDRKMFREYVNNLVVWDPDAPPQSLQFLAFGNDNFVGLHPLKTAGSLLLATANRLGKFTELDGKSNAYLSSLIGSQQSIETRNGSLSANASGERIRLESYDGAAFPRVFSFDLAALSFLQFASGSDAAESLLGDPQYVEPSQDRKLIGTQWDTREFLNGLPAFFGKKFDPKGRLFDPAKVDLAEATADVAATKDGQVLWGTNHTLRLVRNGKDFAEVTCSLSIKHGATLVALAQNDTMAVVAHADGALRWYRINRDKQPCEFTLLLTLYGELSRDGTILNWAVSKPNGEFYANSPDSDLLGWQSTEKDQVRFDPLIKFLTKYFTREGVQRALQASARDHGTEPSAPRLAVNSPNIGEAIKKVHQAYIIRQLNTDEQMLSNAKLPAKLRLDFSAPPGPNYWPLEVDFVVGEFSAAARLSRNGSSSLQPGVPIRLKEPGTYEFDIFLPPKALNKKGALDIKARYRQTKQICDQTSCKKEITGRPFSNISWVGDAPDSGPKRRVFAVLAGFSNYEKLDKLHYSHKDAADIAMLLMRDFERAINQPASEFQDLHIKMILSYEDTKDNRDLMDYVNKQAQRLKSQTGGFSFEIQKVDLQKKGADDDARVSVLAALGEFAKQSDAAYLDTIIFYFSGHGASEGRAASGEDPKNYLAIPTSVKPDPNTPQVFTFKAQSLTFGEIVGAVANSTAEKLYIIDACRVPIGAEKDTETGQFYRSLSTLFDTAKLKTPFHVFVATGQGEKSFGLSYDDFDRQYADLYNEAGSSFAMPPGLRGNGVFTNVLLESLFCKDILRPFEENKITPRAMGDFIDSYFSMGKSLDSLRTALKRQGVTTLPQPLWSDQNTDNRFKSWYHLLDSNAKICLRNNLY